VETCNRIFPKLSETETETETETERGFFMPPEVLVYESWFLSSASRLKPEQILL